MTTIDKSGSSVEEIIRAFRNEYQIRDWELNYEILKKPSKGIFGLFASKIALVRFQLPSPADRAKLFSETLLKKMGISFTKINTKMEGKTLYLEIIGCKDTGFLIGKNGMMLETIQFLVNRIFEDDRKLDKIYLDADGYRERREAQFIRPFIPQIAKIKVHGKPMTLDPMTAAERRIIHRHVERDKALRTLTIGEGEMKRIVVFSAKQNEKEALSQSKSSTQEEKAAPREKREEKAAPREKREERPPRPPRSPRPQNKEEQSETRPTRNSRPARPENQDAKAEIREARPPRQGRPRFDRNRRRPNKSANDGNE